MKFQFVFGLFLFFGSSFAAEELRALQDETDATPLHDAADPDSPGFFDRVGAFLDSTLNGLQEVKIPTLGSGAFLTTLDCAEEVRADSACHLAAGVNGVNTCRNVASVPVTMCAPYVFDYLVGTVGDSCGPCNGETTLSVADCACPCQEGRGVRVKHNLFKVFQRQISYTACYTPNVAANVINARPEFDCDSSCVEPSDLPDTDQP